MITDEMVEKGAIAGLEGLFYKGAWAWADDLDRKIYRIEVRAALEAVAPDIRNAALEEAKDAVSIAGWYRSNDSDVAWEVQAEQVGYSMDAIEALKEPTP